MFIYLANFERKLKTSSVIGNKNLLQLLSRRAIRLFSATGCKATVQIWHIIDNQLYLFPLVGICHRARILIWWVKSRWVFVYARLSAWNTRNYVRHTRIGQLSDTSKTQLVQCPFLSNSPSAKPRIFPVLENYDSFHRFNLHYSSELDQFWPNQATSITN